MRDRLDAHRAWTQPLQIMRTDGLNAFDDVTRAYVASAMARNQSRRVKANGYKRPRRQRAPPAPGPSMLAAIEWQAAHDAGRPISAEIVGGKYGVEARLVHYAAYRLRLKLNAPPP